jgi:hypothetical protein
MADELAALDHTYTWNIVPLPSHAVPITCKWVFKVKTKFDSSIERYKARLVARGFLQAQGRDFDETFAPAAHDYYSNFNCCGSQLFLDSLRWMIKMFFFMLIYMKKFICIHLLVLMLLQGMFVVFVELYMV